MLTRPFPTQAKAPVHVAHMPEDDGWSDEGWSTGRPRPIENNVRPMSSSTDFTVAYYGAAGIGAGLFVAAGIMFFRGQNRVGLQRNRVGRVGVQLGAKHAERSAGAADAGASSAQLESS